MCRIKYNNELYSLYEELCIVKMIKIATLKWSGYIMRMEHNVPCSRTTFYLPEYSRKKGRPRLMWLDLVLKYLKTLEMNA